MTDFGVISDIHGNLEALTQVWQTLEADGMGNRIVLNAGDTVAYGSQSEECIQYLKSKPTIVSVAGNYDTAVLRFPEKGESYQRKWGASRPDKYEAIRQASAAISEDSRAWLEALPLLRELELAGQSVSLSHYAPAESKEGLGSWTSSERLNEIAGEVPYRAVVIGHTHTPFVRLAGGVVFINPGSVGRSMFGISYAVMTIGQDGSMTAEVRRCPG